MVIFIYMKRENKIDERKVYLLMIIIVMGRVSSSFINIVVGIVKRL